MSKKVKLHPLLLKVVDENVTEHVKDEKMNPSKVLAVKLLTAPPPFESPLLTKQMGPGNRTWGETLRCRQKGKCTFGA